MTGNDKTTDGVDRRTVLTGLGSLAGMSALAGCSRALGRSTGDHLRYLQPLGPTTLDPISADDPWSIQATSQIFQGLYAYDRALNLVPVLATGPPEVSDDGKTYTVSLETAARFQNGNPVTAADVAYSLDPTTYTKADSPNQWAVNPIEDIRTPDDHTVEFHLEYPYPAFQYTLTRAVMPETVRKQDPDAFGRTHAVGSGPFKFETFERGNHASFTAWSDYWRDGQPAIERLRMVTNESGLSRSMSLRTGQSDIIERVHPRLWTVTDGFPDASVASTPAYHSFFIGFDCGPGGPTRHPDVRKAVDHLLATDELVSRIVEPAGRRQYSPLPRQLAADWNLPLDDWREIPRQKNVQRARKLVEAAGVKHWTPLIATPHDPLREKFAAAIVRGLRKIGFGKARVRKYHWSEFRDVVTTGDSSDYDMFVGSWAGVADPDTFLYPLFHERMEGLTNGTFYQNERVMEQLQRARETTDRQRRRRLYADAITTILEDRVHLPAFTLHNSFGVADHVQGFEPHPLPGGNPRAGDPSNGRELKLTD